MQNFIIFILFFYFYLISVISYGKIFQNIIFNKYKLNLDISIYTGFYGLTFLTLISLFTSFFLKHGYQHNIILHSIGFIYFFFSDFKKDKVFYKHIFYLSIFAILILLISKTHDDFSYYHLPFTKFLTENHIIFGMGHLNLGYNFLSSLFFLNSTFYLPFINLYSFHFSIIFFLIFFNYFLLKEIFYNSINIFFKYFYLLAFVFFNLSFNRLSEYGMDKPGQLLIVILVLKLFEVVISEKKITNGLDLLILLPLLGLCISTKTYFLSYILLSFSMFFLKENFYNLLKIIFFSLSFFSFALIIIFMFLHHFISTGCIISPLPYLCFSDIFDWSRSLDDVKDLAIWLEQWSKAGAGPDFRIDNVNEYIKNFNWLSNWYEMYFLVKVLDQIGIYVASILIIFFISKKFSFSNSNIFFYKKFLVFYCLLFIIFFIWFTNHPALRYGGYSISFLIISFPIVLFLSSISDKKNFLLNFKYLIVVVIFIVNFKNFNRIGDEFKRNDLYKYSDFPFFSIAKKDYREVEYDNGLKIFSAHHCWATPTPCGNIGDNISVVKKNNYFFINIKKFTN